MDYETARINMIEQQIRPCNVLETRTLNALSEIRREDFVTSRYHHLAFVDTWIPLGDNQVMLEPKVSARMIEALELEPGHRVLEIGAGSGYTAALMASLGAQVTSIEIRSQLSEQAKRNLAMAGIDNVTVQCADGFSYCENQSASEPFDRMLVTGSVPRIGEVFPEYDSCPGKNCRNRRQRPGHAGCNSPGNRTKNLPVRNQCPQIGQCS